MRQFRFCATIIAFAAFTAQAQADVDLDCVRDGTKLGVDICVDAQSEDFDFQAFAKCMSDGILEDITWWCSTADVSSKPATDFSAALEQKGMEKAAE